MWSLSEPSKKQQSCEHHNYQLSYQMRLSASWRTKESRHLRYTVQYNTPHTLIQGQYDNWMFKYSPAILWGPAIFGCAVKLVESNLTSRCERMVWKSKVVACGLVPASPKSSVTWPSATQTTALLNDTEFTGQFCLYVVSAMLNRDGYVWWLAMC